MRWRTGSMRLRLLRGVRWWIHLCSGFGRRVRWRRTWFSTPFFVCLFHIGWEYLIIGWVARWGNALSPYDVLKIRGRCVWRRSVCWRNTVSEFRAAVVFQTSHLFWRFVVCEINHSPFNTQDLRNAYLCSFVESALLFRTKPFLCLEIEPRRGGWFWKVRCDAHEQYSYHWLPTEMLRLLVHVREDACNPHREDAFRRVGLTSYFLAYNYEQCVNTYGSVCTKIPIQLGRLLLANSWSVELMSIG